MPSVQSHSIERDSFVDLVLDFQEQCFNDGAPFMLIHSSVGANLQYDAAELVVSAQSIANT